MKKSTALSFALVLILIGLGCPLALGQPSLADNTWDFEFTPYLWIPELDTDSRLGGLSGSAEMDFSDFLDFVDFAGSARLEAWKQNWGLLFDALYLDLGADYSKVTGPGGRIATNADVDSRQALLDFGLAYRLIDTPVGKGEGQRLTFEPLAGVRYAYLKAELRLDVAVAGIGGVGTRLGGSEEWVEPFVGFRIRWHLNDKLSTGVRTDFGGFGIGSASDLIWNFIAGVDYELSDRMSLNVGYRILDIDYEGGSGRSEIGLNGQLRGPIVGLTFHF